jgi:hypothetical protein
MRLTTLSRKIAVVADDQQRALPGAQHAFQPLHRLHVEVVGRLVQDEQVGLFQQQARQQSARLLPAAQLHEICSPLGAG